MEITQQELSEKLNWSLSQKIDHSLYIIESFIAQFPNCVISFSGGIDSTVMLFLTRIIDKNRKGVFVNTTNEHTEILKFIRTIENIETILPKITFIQVVEKYGFPLISKEQAQYIREARHTKSKKLLQLRLYGRKGNQGKISNKWQHLINAPFEISEQCCYHLKKKPFYNINKNGVLIGTMLSDSRLRKQIYLQTSCINIKNKRATPLSIWTKQDIWNFIKQNKIEYCDVYDKGERSTGCAYCGFGCQFDKTRFDRLKEREPKRYEQMMNLKNNGVTYKEAIKIALKLE